NLLAIAVTTEYSFEAAEKVKEYLANPEAFAAAAPTTTAAPAAADEEKPAEKEEEKEESDEDMGFGLFD
ncbi:hypothetical protein FRC08_007570, partial [Ceratobasidium sp. 394]